MYRLFYSLFFFLATLFLLEGRSLSFFSNGSINSRFSYTDLKITGQYLRGKIINKTSLLQENVLIKFYATDHFGKYCWTAIVSISAISPKSSTKFSSYVPFHPGETAKFRIEVVRPKKVKKDKYPKIVNKGSKESKGEIHIRISGSKIKIWGEGQQASKPFKLKKGFYTFNFKHRGDKHFSIWLMGTGGKKNLITNKIGRFSGSKGVSVKKNKYFLNIKANLDAKWSITIEHLDELDVQNTTDKEMDASPKTKHRKLRVWKDKNGVTHISQ